MRKLKRALSFTLPGEAPRLVKRPVMASSAMLYSSDGKGCDDSPCQRLAHS